MWKKDLFSEVGCNGTFHDLSRNGIEGYFQGGCLGIWMEHDRIVEGRGVLARINGAEQKQGAIIV